ncbi:hypothetical protein U6N30_21040 [Blastococcus brunescens]|uniref:Uncharacterized protein n=1 Tax=Blastococcus brunescens TaxID=1564165 RepID=A0ABZ1AVD7_9ACTN|nr:hypothetical protein [Blastococcus sp. BMG 8361]WRL62480.1 hypothetical protein U6N30_21040 [Blastococcus sp. BMG 8361]
MVPPPEALACWIAARSEHCPHASAHFPSAGSTSAVSFVVVTSVLFWPTRCF